MLGIVRGREALIELNVSGAVGSLVVTAAIDTGFDGYLTLPRRLASSLQLPLVGNHGVALADGSVVVLDVVRGNVEWQAQTRPIHVMVTEGKILAGMALMEDCRVQIDVCDGGKMFIEPMA